MNAREVDRRQRGMKVAERAALSARVQRRRGAEADARRLYYEAHSLLRLLRQHLAEDRAA